MPALQNKNIPVLDRKEFQMMTPAPVATAAGSFMISAGTSYPDKAMFVSSSTVVYLYSHAEDGWIQVPSPALAGTFGAGADGAYSPWSNTYTATGGSTTTIQVSAATQNLTAEVVGKTVEFISAGTATGQRRVITAIDSNAGTGTQTLTLDYPVATAILNTHTFRVMSGRFYVLGAGTLAAGSFKAFDVGTMTWGANLTITNLPATVGTDGRLVCTARTAQVLANGAATGGSSTTVVDTAQNWSVDAWKGYFVFIVSGTGAGQCARITGNTANTLTVVDSKTNAALSVAPAAASVYQIRAFDVLASGVATGGSATTLVNSAKTWTVNQWTNSQVRIVSGTGAGQKSLISSNTATTLTIATGAVIDTTSVYEIEPCEDYIYYAGNNAVTMYRYGITANAWTVLAPTTARAAAPTTGMCLDFVGDTSDPLWGNENNIQDGRYLYSMRGAAGGAIDRFDIAGGTAGAGAWTAMTQGNATETFTTGSSAFQFGRFLYIKKDATNRFFKYDIPGNVMLPFYTDLFPDGAGLLGQKLWVKALDGTDQVAWVYHLLNTSTVLRRIGIV